MRWIFTACSALVLLAGCISSTNITPVSHQSFELRDAAGLYSNAGVDTSGVTASKLTEVLFPGDSRASLANAVRVKVLGSSRVRCEALERGRVLSTKDFQKDVDFDVEENHVKLGTRLTDMGSSGAQSVVLAAGTATRTIGITPSRDLVLRTSSRGGALAFMLVPVGMSDVTDIVFRRMD